MYHNSKKKLRGPRHSPQTIISEGGEPYLMLAASIVAQAITDAKLLQKGHQVRNSGMVVNETELIKFFEGQWCSILLGPMDLTGQEIREKVMM